MCCPSFTKKQDDTKDQSDKLPRRRSIHFKTNPEILNLDLTQIELSHTIKTKNMKDSESATSITVNVESEVILSAQEDKKLVRKKYQRKGRSGSDSQVRRSRKESCASSDIFIENKV